MEWGKSIFIILVFVVLVGHVATSIGVKNIQENWPLYRCNPLIMPFAATFSPTPTTARDNFSFCVNDNLTSFGPSLTQPLSYVQNVTLDLLAAMTTSNEKSMKQSSNFSFSVSNMFTSVYQVLVGMVGKFNLLIIKMMDAQGKIMGSMVALMHIITAVQYTFLSMWEGIPGTMIRSFSSLSKVKK
jgi:hypothetical protein